MSRRPHLAALSILLANSAAIHTGYLLASETATSTQPALPIWWCCVALTYGVLALFLRRPRSLRGVILIAVGGYAAQMAAALLAGVRYPSVLSWLIVCTLWGTMYCRACVFALRPPKAEQVITAFEIAAAVLLFTSFVVAGGAAAPAALYPLAFAVLLTLMALACLRSGHRRVSGRSSHPVKGRLYPILLLCLLGGGTAALALLITGSAAEQLTRFSLWLKTAAKGLLGLVEKFFLRLAALLPHSAPGEVSPPEASGIDGVQALPTEELVHGGGFVLYLLFGLLLLTAAAVLIRLWRRGGSVHLSGGERAAGAVSRKGSGFARILARLWRRVLYWHRYLTRYNTPAGLLIWVELRAKHRRIPRRPGETARAFLLRLRPLLPQCEEELVRLADCLDEMYFSPADDTPSLPVAALRRKFRKQFAR